MDTTQARRAILARLKAGEISEDQADAELERLLNPPKRGRGRPKGTGKRKQSIFIGKERAELKPPRYRRKPSQRELTIGRHYTEQVESGIKPMIAMRHTLKQFSTKRAPLEDSSVRRYAGLFKKWRQEQIEWRRQWLEFHKKIARQTYQANIESALDIARRQIEAFESEARERFKRASEAAQSLIRRGFEVGQKK